MSLYKWLFGESHDANGETFAPESPPLINPANGLPMLDDCIDIAGNQFGFDGSDQAVDQDCSCGGDLWTDNADGPDFNWD